MASNVDILTRAHSALKAKARAKKNQIDSIVFDEDARLEFLTGFRKRKLQKKEAAKQKAKERERQERLQLRKEKRQALRERAQENARQVESSFKESHGDNESDDEKVPKLTPSDKGKGKATREFEDEEQLATVTIVEEFDPDALRHMPSTSRGTPDSKWPSESEIRPDIRVPSRSDVKIWGGHTTTAHPVSRSDEGVHPPSKKGKIQPKRTAYETQASRKAVRVKQHTRKLERANLANRRGGKSKTGRR